MDEKRVSGMYFLGEAEETLRRIAAAVVQNPVATDDLVKAAEFLAVCTSYGLTVTDVLLNGIRAYPHLMEMMAQKWDMRPAAAIEAGSDE